MKGEIKYVRGQLGKIIAHVEVPTTNPSRRPIVLQVVQMEGSGDYVVLRNDFAQGQFGAAFLDGAQDCFLALVRDDSF